MSLPAATYGLAQIDLLDAGNEVGSIKCYGAVVTADNFADQAGLWDTFVTKVQAACLGALQSHRYENYVTVDAAQPTNGAAREFKLVLHYKDAITHEKYTMSIPTIKSTEITYLAGYKDVVIATTPTWLTQLITAFTDFAVAPRTGNAVVVWKVTVVGRNI